MRNLQGSGIGKAQKGWAGKQCDSRGIQIDLLQSVIDGIADPVIAVGADYRVWLANAAAQAIWSEDGSQLYCHQLSHGSDVPCSGVDHSCPLQRVLAGETEVRVVHEHVSSDGAKQLVELSAKPIRDDRGEVVGMLQVAHDITALAESKAALARANLLLRKAQRLAHIGSWERRFDDDRIVCSDEMCLLAGNRCGDVCSFAGFIAAIHADDREDFRRGYERSIAERRPFEMTHRLIQADGVVIYVHSHCETQYDAAGRPEVSYGTVQDVTMKVLTEMSLKESEERFRTIADYTYDWEYWVGPQGEILYCSPSCREITGHAASEFVAQPALLQSIIHPDDQALMAAHHETVRQQDTDALVFRIVRTDGEVRWISHGCRPVRGRDGRYMGRRASNRDITDLKRAELEYQTILQTATDGFLLVGMDRRILDCNDAYCAMTGYAKEELRTMGVAGIEAAQSPAEQAQLIDKLREFGHLRFETRHHHKDGRIIDVEVSVSYIDFDGGKLVAFVRDISERKQAEERIRQLAYYDPLTGLPNRRLLLDRLQRALAQAKRFRRSIAIMFLDLDRFKQVNDTLGHSVGDELLRQVAKRLTTCVRQGDTVARPGGDEFVIVLTEVAQPQDAVLVSEKIIDALKEPVLLADHELSLDVTTSIGIAIYPIDGSDDSEELMKKADMAMYQAKAAGRNTYRIYSATL